MMLLRKVLLLNCEFSNINFDKQKASESMTISPKLKHLRAAFNDLGCDCEVKPTDNPDEATFMIDKGEDVVEFTARAEDRRGLSALLRSYAHTVHIEADDARMRVPFGHKNPDRTKRRFYMTGLNREAGDCPVEHHKRIEARKLARDIKQKLGL